MHAAVSSRLVSLALLKKYKARGGGGGGGSGFGAERGVVGSAHAGVGASSFTSSSSSPSRGVRERKTNAIDVFRFVQNHHLRRDDDEDEDEKKRSKDVVVIFAWFGSEKKHVAKYAHMYEDKHEEVIVVAPPALASLSPKLTTQIANDFLRIFREKDVEGVHVHSFSNGGFLFAGNLLYHASDKRDDKECKINVELAKKWKTKIKSVTLDCAPARLNANVISRAFASVLLGSRVEDIYDNDAKEGGGESRMGELAKSALDVLAETLLSDENLQRKINNAYAAWETELDTNVPLKMLFSESDKLVPVNEVQEFAQRQRARGNARVFTKCFKNVPHCEIGRWHQDEYMKVLFDEKI
jgi:hypothetical protein